MILILQVLKLVLAHGEQYSWKMNIFSLLDVKMDNWLSLVLKSLLLQSIYYLLN